MASVFLLRLPAARIKPPSEHLNSRRLAPQSGRNQLLQIPLSRREIRWKARFGDHLDYVVSVGKEAANAARVSSLCRHDRANVLVAFWSAVCRDRRGLLAECIGIRDGPDADARPARPFQPPASHRRAWPRLSILSRGVENSPVAGLPPTHTCMTCHSQLYTKARCWRRFAKALRQRSDPLEQSQPVAGLRVFRSFNPHRKRRRLHHLSRRCRHHAADAAGGAADHGLVSRLSSQSGAEPAARHGRFRSELESLRPIGQRECQLVHTTIDNKHLTDCSVCHR